MIVELPKQFLAEVNGLPESFSNAQLKAMMRPCVYLFLKDGSALYIGSSTNGLMRFGAPTHHHADVREQADEVRVIWLKEKVDPALLEAYLIRRLNPPYNGRQPQRNRTAISPPSVRRERGAGCLFLKKGCWRWFMKYNIDRRTIVKSTGTRSRAEAEQVLERGIRRARKKSVTGQRARASLSLNYH
jgi:hypothetical protein